MTRDEARAAWIGLDEPVQRRLACRSSGHIRYVRTEWKRASLGG